MYTTRKNTNGTYTSQGKIATPSYTVEYVEKKTHNFVAILVFLLPAVLLVAFIVSHLS